MKTRVAVVVGGAMALAVGVLSAPAGPAARPWPAAGAAAQAVPTRGAGGRIVFVRQLDHAEGWSGREVYLIDADGTDMRRLTRNAVPDFEPVWSPDGRRIAFTRGEYVGEVYVMAADGSNQRRLATGDGPAWSPDGRRIAYTSWKTGSGEVYIMAADGSNQRRLTSGEDPGWSPDGRRIVFTKATASDSGVYVVGADGSGLRRLRFDRAASDSRPVWSPDGRWIAFDQNREPDRDSVYVMDRWGGHGHSVPGRGPVWSPDGQRIAYIGRGVSLMDADGRHRRRLVAGSDPEWSPDGRRLVVRIAGLHLIKPDGSRLRRLTRGSVYDTDPDWFGAAPTRTRLDARPEPAIRGKPMTVTGKMTKVGVRLPGATVKIRFKAKGARTFRTVTTVTTGPAGRYRTTVTARRSGMWKAVHPATVSTMASSANDKVTVRRAG